MSDQDDDKKNINQDTTDNESVNQPSVDKNNQPEGVDSTNDDSSGDENKILLIFYNLEPLKLKFDKIYF